MSPTFLCLGGQRCGTTWLYEALKQCPTVQVSRDKETDFFNRKLFSQNLADYESYFDGLKGRPVPAVCGEVSPNYCLLKRPGIELIHQLYPDLRLVLILRNPVERSISQAWLDLCYLRHRPERRLRAFEYLLHAERWRTQRRNDYAAILRDWRAVFGTEALYVALYDDLVAEPRGFFRAVLRHIGADDWLLPEPLAHERVFASGTPQPSAFIRWYYARACQEQVAALNDLLPGRVTPWLRDIEALLAEEKPWWNWLRRANKHVLALPEKFAFAAYDAWRAHRYQERAAALLRQRDAAAAARLPASPYPAVTRTSMS